MAVKPGKKTSQVVPQVEKKPKKAAPKDEDSVEESSENSEAEEPVLPVKGKKANGAKQAAKPKDSEDDSESEDGEMEVAPPVGAAKRKGIPVQKAAPQAKKTKQEPKKGKVEESDEDDDDEEDEEEDEEEDDEEDEEEEETVAQPVKVSKGKPVKTADDDDEEDDDEEDEEDDDEEDEEDDEEEKPKGKQAKSQQAEGAKVTLFVGNLPKELENKPEALAKFFKKNGVKITEYRGQDKKRFCFVDLVDPADKDKALALSGSAFHGEELQIQIGTEGKGKAGGAAGAPGGDKQQDQKREQNDKCTLFVKNLSFKATQESLQEVFTEATSIRIPVNDEGRAKGIAYIQFESEDKVEEAMKEYQGAEIEGRAIMLDYVGAKSSYKKDQSFGSANQSFGNAKQSGEAGKAKTLIVMGLNFKTDDEGLHAAFEASTGARVVTDRESGKSKGFGFVDFDTPEAAKSAQEEMNGTEIDGRTVRVDFAQDRGSGGGGRGGGRGRGFGGRGGGRGGRGGGGFGGRGGNGRGGGGRGGGFRGGRGGPRGGQGGGFGEFKGKKKTFDD